MKKNIVIGGIEKQRLQEGRRVIRVETTRPAQNNLHRSRKSMTAPNEILNPCLEPAKTGLSRCLSIPLLLLPVCRRSAEPHPVGGSATAAAPLLS